MNKQELKNFRSFHPFGQSNFKSVKVNVISVSSNNTILHELTKCFCALSIHKFGDVFINERIKDLLRGVEEEIKGMKLKEEHISFITECSPNDQPNRKIDLVRLSDGCKIEIVKSSDPPDSDDCVKMRV